LFILVTKFWLWCDGLCKFIYKQWIQLSETFRMGCSQGTLQNQISENWKKTSTACAHRTIPILTDILLNDLLCNIVASQLQILVYLTTFLECNYTFCCYLLLECATVSCYMEIFTVFYHLIMFNLISYVFFFLWTSYFSANTNFMEQILSYDISYDKTENSRCGIVTLYWKTHPQCRN